MFTNASQTAIRAEDRVHVRETASGTWIVRDERDRRGGRFNDRRTALRFVHREFGRNTEIVMRPTLATLNARRLTSSDQIRLSRSTQATRATCVQSDADKLL